MSILIEDLADIAAPAFGERRYLVAGREVALTVAHSLEITVREIGEHGRSISGHYASNRAALEAFHASVDDGREEQTPACVRCGLSPWGFGYCSELCEKCAADDEAEDARLAEEHQTASAANVW